MSGPVPSRPDRTAMLLAAFGFLALGVMTFVQIIITSRTGNRSRFLGGQLVGGVTIWIGWAAVAPAIIALTRRSISPGDADSARCWHIWRGSWCATCSWPR